MGVTPTFWTPNIFCCYSGRVSLLDLRTCYIEPHPLGLPSVCSLSTQKILAGPTLFNMLVCDQDSRTAGMLKRNIGPPEWSAMVLYFILIDLAEICIDRNN